MSFVTKIAIRLNQLLAKMTGKGKQMANKLYAKRDKEPILDLYSSHINAMTVEGLYSKADIAAELAFRDARVAELEAELFRLRSALPKTADGVSVVPGMTLYYLRPGAKPKEYRISGFNYDDPAGIFSPISFGTVYFNPDGFSSIWRWDQCYSTLEAAQAAQSAK